MKSTPIMMQAKALYDNIAETSEELAFRRGDVLTVLEQDTSGLDGWWLCSLKGRRGIVPGNRLRVLDRILGQKESALLAYNAENKCRSGNAAMSGDRTWQQNTKVVTPQRHGNMLLYDVPQKALSAAKSMDYDIPQSSAALSVNCSGRTALSGLDMDYDHPISNRPIQQKHSPGSQDHLQLNMQISMDHYDIPGSNRSSTVSMMSTGSNMSGLSSGSGAQSSICESGRSSMDLSGHEAYDIPQSARLAYTPGGKTGLPPRPHTDCPLYDTPKSQGKYSHGHSKSLDLTNDYDVLKTVCAIDIYDTPRKPLHQDSLVPSKSAHTVSRNSSSGDSGISLIKNKVLDTSPIDCDYDTPAKQNERPPSGQCVEEGNYDVPKSAYDTPKNIPNKSPFTQEITLEAKLGNSKLVSDVVSIYDVPPCVTKDLGDSLLQGNAQDSRTSMGSNDSDVSPQRYKELRMELNAAMETLVSLQHAITTSCAKLHGFIHPNWRAPDHLKPRIYDIEVCAMSVNGAGMQFLHFGQGALMNASNSDDKRLTQKMSTAVETLNMMLRKFSACIERLCKEMWPLMSLVRYKETPQPEDDLDIIMNLAREIPEIVKSISGLIQGNSMQLFRRSGGVSGHGIITSTPTSVQKTKVPPPVKPKPRLSVDSQTPLPKFSEKSSNGSSPETDTKEQKLIVSGNSSPDDSKVAEHRASIDADQGDYDVPKPLATPGEAQKLDSTEKFGLIEEYDYVSLTKDPMIVRAQRETSPEKKNTDTGHVVERRNQDSVVSTKSEGGRSKVVQSLFPPDSPKSGTSSQCKDKLYTLQKESEEPVLVHTEDYDIPQSHRIDRNTSTQSQVMQPALLDTNDVMLLKFYTNQVDLHSGILVNAVEAFIKCIDEKQSPQNFIAYSKFVILAAHKMVYIGDTLTRHLSNDVVRNEVMNKAYMLCELLKVTVTTTKKAALEYPSVKSVQDMVDKVSEVSVVASRLRQVITSYCS